MEIPVQSVKALDPAKCNLRNPLDPLLNGPWPLSLSIAFSNGISLAITLREDGQHYDLTATGFPDKYTEKLECLRNSFKVGSDDCRTMQGIFGMIVRMLAPLSRQSEHARRSIIVWVEGGEISYLPGFEPEMKFARKFFASQAKLNNLQRSCYRIFNADGEKLTYLPGIEEPPELP